jgi:hypothetical protein
MLGNLYEHLGLETPWSSPFGKQQYETKQIMHP